MYSSDACINSAALRLFNDSKEDALEFLEDHTELDDARILLLTGMGRILEVAEIHANSGNMLKAVRALIKPADYRGNHARPAIEYLLAGIRSELTFGALPDSCQTVPKLLRCEDQLEKNLMTEQEIDEVRSPNSLDRRVLHCSISSSRCLRRF